MEGIDSIFEIGLRLSTKQFQDITSNFSIYKTFNGSIPIKLTMVGGSIFRRVNADVFNIRVSGGDYEKCLKSIQKGAGTTIIFDPYLNRDNEVLKNHIDTVLRNGHTFIRIDYNN